MQVISKSASDSPAAPNRPARASRRAMLLVWGAMVLASVLIWVLAAVGFAAVLGIG